MSEVDRLYSYKTILNGRRAVPRSEILKKLEISPATFKRDLAKLRNRLNIPVIFDKDLEGYKLDVTDSREELPGLWFSQEEILALLTIQNMIGQLEPGLLGPKLKPLQKRLDGMLASHGLDAQTLAQRVRLVHAGKRRLHIKCFEAITKATLERKRIKIHHYNRQTGITVERVISPQQLVHYRDNWYIDSWCHLRDEIRSFAVDAIPECELLPDGAKNVDPDQLRLAMSSGYGIFGGQAIAWAKLKFSPERARWARNEEWHPEQKTIDLADGSYVIEVPYSDERELLADVMKYGADVEVIGPESLRKSIKVAMLKSLKHYD